MKRQGNRIITDDDIAISESLAWKNKSLAEFIDTTETRMSNLESYLKWIYKHGGVGSGSGGGGGVSGGGGGGSNNYYTVYVTLGGTQIKGTTGRYELSGKKKYDLILQAINPGLSTVSYTVNYKRLSNTGVIMSATPITGVLDSSNGYTTTIEIDLNVNGRLDIEFRDSVYNYPRNIGGEYIVDNYKFDYFLSDHEGVKIGSGNSAIQIYSADAQSKKLSYTLKYTISTNVKVSYELKFNLVSGSVWTQTGVLYDPATPGDYILGTERTKIIQLYGVNVVGEGVWEAKDKDAGYYSVELKLTTQKTGASPEEVPGITPVSFSIVPNNLYLMVSPQEGTIYNSNPIETGIIETCYKFNPGYINFVVRGYQGRENGEACDIYYALNDVSNPENYGKVTTTIGETVNIAIPINSREWTASNQGVQSVYFHLFSGGSHYPAQAPGSDGIQEWVRYYIVIKKVESSVKWAWANTPKDEDTSGSWDKIVTANYYRGYGSGGVEVSTAAKPLGDFQTLRSLQNNGTITQSISKNPIVLNDGVDFASTSQQKFTTILNIGFQYSELNDDNSPIFTLMRLGEENIGDWLTISQNQIKFSTRNTCNINYYFPKTKYEEYGYIHSESFHFLTLVFRYVGERDGTLYHEVGCYIDGIFEGMSKSYMPVDVAFTKLTVNKANVLINQVEMIYKNPIGALTDDYTGGEGNVEDLSVYQHYLAYRGKILSLEVSDSEAAVISVCDSFKVQDDGNVLVRDWAKVIEASRVVGVPTFVAVIEDSDGTVKAKLDSRYEEDDSLVYTIPEIYWSNGDKNGTLSKVEFPKDGTGATTMPNARWQISMQGSSTKSYKCKNWDLKLINDTQGDSTDKDTYLFSPNFKNAEGLTGEDQAEAYKTFLPEEVFTLKADVVDSSHSNNTSIGKFVNAISTPFGNHDYDNGPYKGYIKNCLDGFPIVVYIGIKTTKDNGEKETVYYYQGIFNFNLGRSSYYNLGYKNTQDFSNDGGVTGNLKDAAGGFTFAIVPGSNSALKPNLIVAEIQGNSAFFDFSQYDNSILFQSVDDFGNPQSADLKYMFGDIVRGNQIGPTAMQAVLRDTVKSTSLAGGYLFEELLKKSMSNLASNNYGYGGGDESEGGYRAMKTISVGGKDTLVPANQVPNYRWRAVKQQEGSEYVFKFSDSNYEGSTRQWLDVINLIGGQVGDTEYPARFDYNSLSEYYTICMAFGLVDSVQKNMNIKTWNASHNQASGDTAGTFYAAFYDMDTCLGLSNKGTEVNYFAFSDYWVATEKKNGSVVQPSSASIYRDFAPPKTATDDNAYYDTASSYLFAVAKYANFNNDIISAGPFGINNNPRMLWARWRSPLPVTGNNPNHIGCLKNAKHFIDNFFSNNLKKVAGPFINMNYRNKYFHKSSNTLRETTFSTTNFEKFNGTRIEKATDWLEGRFHILDAYFNLTNNLSPVLHYAPVPGKVDSHGRPTEYSNELTEVKSAAGVIINEPNIDVSTLALNSVDTDVIILQDIFSSGSINQSSVSLNFNIKTKEFSPLIIKVANDSHRYLLAGGLTQYNIIQTLEGVQTYAFYGSGAWTELDSINSFAFDNLYVNSKYLKTLSGSLGSTKITGENIKMDSLEDISLTSAGYSLELTGKSQIDANKFPNLKEANFGGVGFANILFNNSGVAKITISKIKEGSIKILNCKNLSNAITLDAGTNSSTNPSIKLTDLTINPVPPVQCNSASGMVLRHTNIKDISLTNISSEGNSKVVIANDDAVEKITLAGFSNVYIESCTNLKTIILTNPLNEGEGDRLKTLYINSCAQSSHILTVKTSSDSVVADGTVDLSIHTGLTDITRLSNIPINAIKLPTVDGYEVNVKGSCFTGDSGLKTIDVNKMVVKNANNLFYNCSSFTGKSSTGDIINLYFGAGITSLDGFMACSGGSSVNMNDVVKNWFETKSRWLTTGGVSDGRSLITSARGCFHGQRGLTYTQADLVFDLGRGLNNGQKRLDLRPFRRLSGVTTMFAWSGYTAWHRDTLGFGQDASSIDFVNFSIGNSDISVHASSLSYIYQKITAIGPSDYGNGYYHRYFFHADNGTRSAWNLKSFLRPGGGNATNLVTIWPFYLDPSYRCDLTQTFCNGSGTSYMPSLTKLYRFLPTDSSNDYSSARVIGFSSLFKDVSSLRYLFASLNTTSNQSIDLYTMFDWDHLLTGERPFENWGTSSGRNDGCISLTKTISYEDWVNLWSNKIYKIGKNYLKSLNYIFRNCTVYVKDQNDEHLLSDILRLDQLGVGDMSKVIEIAGLFKNLRARKGTAGNGDDIYLNFPNNFCSYIFKNTRDFSYVFEGIRFNTSIPINFFNRRTYTESSCYIATSEPRSYVNTEGDAARFGARIWASEENLAKFKLGRVRKYYYRRDITNLDHVFYNCRWNSDPSYGIRARFYRPELEDERLESNYWIEDGQTEIKIFNGDGQYYSIDGSTPYYTKSSLSYNIPQEIPNPDPEDAVENPTIIDYVPASMNVFTTDSTRRIVYGTENSEITDANDLTGKGDYSASFRVVNPTSNNYINWELGDPNEAVSRLFIAPDFFYGCTETCYMGYCFGNGSNHAECLEGMIPENLLKNSKKGAITHMMQNLNIIPRYLCSTPQSQISTLKENVKTYVFVPKNFTNYGDLSSSFTFRIILPPAGALQNGISNYNEYFIFQKGSIGSECTSLANSLPSIMKFTDPSQAGIPNYWYFGITDSYDLGSHYGICCDEQGNDNGLEISRLSSMGHDNIIPAGSDLLRVLWGKIFEEGFIANNVSLTGSNYSITAVPRQNGGTWISKHAKLPKANADFNNMVRIFNPNCGTNGITLGGISNFVDSKEVTWSAYRTLATTGHRVTIDTNK